MLRQKSFFKVTPRGTINKTVKEHYLRDDIPCGVLGCTKCDALYANLTERPTLLDPSQQTSINKVVGRPHIILVDTNLLLHHLDVLETPPFRDLVILQTVLEEVKGNNMNIHRRVRALIGQAERRLFVFSNENHRETFVERIEGETDNDRNDRSIRQAASWYRDHLAPHSDLQHYDIVLLTNDVANASLAREKGLRAISLREYVQGLVGVYEETNKLLDMLSSAKDEIDRDFDEYPEHLSEALLKNGVQSGQFKRGTFQPMSHNKSIASITVDGVAIRIIGKKHMNRALPGDTVVVELLHQDHWMAEGDKIKDDEEEDAPEKDELAVGAVPEELLTDAVPEEEPVDKTPSERTPCGRVVGILRRSPRAYCASIDRKTIKSDLGSQSVLVVPMDRKMPRIRIRTSNAKDWSTQRLLISIDGWERKSRFPHGHLVRLLGIAGERATETQVILLEHDVAYEDFTQQVLACLPSADWAPTEMDYQQRTDFRHLPICSVDPPGCTDIDDALHAFPLPNGNYEVGVHIADVTHFVQADTPLDHEASQRSTTVYLVDKRIDMLPSLLGTNLCSLKSNVERFAFSCVWELSPKAEIVSTRFCKSVIASRASLTYDQAQERLESSAPSNDPITGSLKILNSLAKILKSRRIEAGALTLASPEVRFTLDTETQNPVDVSLKEMKDANSMVEEFMLLANISVAQRIYEHFPETAVLRRHPSPPGENFAALNRALEDRQIAPLDVSTSKSLADSLDRIHLDDDPFFNKLVRIMTTRCMYQAQYFAAGSHGYEAFWHYGLACPIYTHFTSPIRRYADVLVHRLLAAAVIPERHGLTGIALADRPRLEEICTNMNYRHRMAQYAQRASIELYTHLYFKGKAVSEAAYVIKLMGNGLAALIPQFGIEGLIRWEESTLKDAGLVFDEDRGKIVNSIDQQPLLGLFQRVRIAISVEEIEVSQQQRLVVKLIEPMIPGISLIEERTESPLGTKRTLTLN